MVDVEKACSVRGHTQVGVSYQNSPSSGLVLFVLGFDTETLYDALLPVYSVVQADLNLVAILLP